MCVADILLINRVQSIPRLWLVHGQPSHAFSLGAFATAVERSSRNDRLTFVFKKSMYPAIIIIIACTQTGQEGYTTHRDVSCDLALTTIRFSIADDTAAISRPTMTTSDGAKSYSENLANEER